MKIKRDKGDILWSQLVRQRDGACRACGRTLPYKLEAHHIRPRGRANTRYDLDNGITLCFVHHAVGDHSIHNRGKEMAYELIGKEEYDRLDKLSNLPKQRLKARTEFLSKYQTQTKSV